MRILLTGGSGFIGSRLTKRLAADGHRVSIFDKVVNLEFAGITIQGDIRDQSQVFSAAKDAEVIFHLAAEHRDDVTPPSLYDEVNVRGTRNVLLAAERSGCSRLIFTSSVAVYPLNACSPDEAFPIAPFNRYGQSKAEAESWIVRWAEAEQSRSAIVTRLCVVFGEGNRGNVYNLLRQISDRRFVMVGQGDNHKSMAYVGNVVEFLVSVLQAGPGCHLFNYADKPDLSTREIVTIARNQLRCAHTPLSRLRLPYALALAMGYAADVVAKTLRRKLPLSAIRVRKFSAETTVSARRVKELGFIPPFSLEEGLRRTIAHEFGGDSQLPPQS